MTVAEYLEDCKEKHENVIYYSNDKAIQAQYISLFESEGNKVAVLSHQLDTQYISMCEAEVAEVKYKRIDSEVSALLRSEDNAAKDESLIDLFKKAVGDDSLDVTFESLKDESIPCLLTLSEESGRMEEMMRMYAGMGLDVGDIPTKYTFVINTSSPIIKKISALKNDDESKACLMAKEIYRLSLMSQRRMTADELKDFLKDSYALLGML